MHIYWAFYRHALKVIKYLGHSHSSCVACLLLSKRRTRREVLYKWKDLYNNSSTCQTSGCCLLTANPPLRTGVGCCHLLPCLLLLVRSCWYQGDRELADLEEEEGIGSFLLAYFAFSAGFLCQPCLASLPQQQLPPMSASGPSTCGSSHSHAQSCHHPPASVLAFEVRAPSPRSETPDSTRQRLVFRVRVFTPWAISSLVLSFNNSTLFSLFHDTPLLTWHGWPFIYLVNHSLY